MHTIVRPGRTGIKRSTSSACAQIVGYLGVIGFGLIFASTAYGREVRLPGGELLTVARSIAGDRYAAVAGTSAEERTRIRAGLRLFLHDWSAPHDGAAVSPLGPRYDAVSCVACHVELGRQQAPKPVPQATLVAKPVTAAQRARYGTQINRHSVVPYSSAIAFEIRHDYRVAMLGDGGVRVLRRPTAVGREADGSAVEFALRAPPLLFGWGLLERVGLETRTLFDDPHDRDRNGISGRLPWADDDADAGITPGLFGWKASHPDARAQVAAALENDMGLASSRASRRGTAAPEIDAAALDALTAYVRAVRVPDRAPQTTAAKRGAAVFNRIGCSNCHVPVLISDPHPDARFSEQVIWPYTDLMLHDLGPALADPGGAPGAREWRTAPLWGVGLVEHRYIGRGFLHDGRAATLEDAILWHGGEAAAAQTRYRALTQRVRGDLLAFLRRL